MGVVITPESVLGKELAKWEQHPSPFAPVPGNPYRYRPYPRMVYRAMKKANGKVVCLEPPPPEYLYREAGEYMRAVVEAEATQKACTKIVDDESQFRLAQGQGWCDSPQEAIAAFEREEQAKGNAAAEAAYAAERMSEKARTEFTAAQQDTHEHVTDLKPAKGARKSVAVNAEQE